MNYVRVDPKKRTVLAGGGALWGAVDHATHAFGLAVPSGIISTTGYGAGRRKLRYLERQRTS
jgi:FAD/FMN-containing dehydrogenase